MAGKKSEPRTKVLIVDDHPAVREALTIRIATLPNLTVIGEAGDLAEALKLAIELKPDLAIIDITLKSGDGIDLIKRIRARDQKMRILVWSMHSESMYAERALRAGAQGYITKEQATSQIIDAIRQVLDGKIYLSSTMSEKLLHRLVGSGDMALERSSVRSLSDRELEVFRLIGNGSKTSEIAKALCLSVKTVETYRDRIRQKLDLTDGTDLVHFASQWVLEKE